MLDIRSALRVDYAVRPPTREDIPTIIDLIAACDLALTGEVERETEDDILAEWSEMRLETDAWVITSPQEQLVGYGNVRNVGLGVIVTDGYTHPDHRGYGIGATILRLGEARAREWISNAPPDALVTVSTGIHDNDKAAHSLLRAEGFGPIRHFWRMQIDLESAPPAPQWPDGVTVRTFVRNRDERATFDAVQEAFQDHWGHVPRQYDDWANFTVNRASFDPTLWFLAWDGDEIAGAALCRQREDFGWVNTLAVRRPWRRRGLGMALLLHAFREFNQRGERRVGLGVDAESLTGATRLYEQAGMRAVRVFTTYAKELRPGRDLSTQSLTA